MADARRRAFDVVVVWRFDRFARSTKQLVLALDEFRALGIDFLSHQEAVDTSTPVGKTMFTVIAAFAEIRAQRHPRKNHGRSALCTTARHQEWPADRSGPQRCSHAMRRFGFGHKGFLCEKSRKGWA